MICGWNWFHQSWYWSAWFVLILGFGFHIQIFNSENGLLVPMTGWDFGVLPSSVYCNILGILDAQRQKWSHQRAEMEQVVKPGLLGMNQKPHGPMCLMVLFKVWSPKFYFSMGHERHIGTFWVYWMPREMVEVVNATIVYIILLRLAQCTKSLSMLNFWAYMGNFGGIWDDCYHVKLIPNVYISVTPACVKVDKRVKCP